MATLLEADSALLICRTTPRVRKNMKEMRDFYFLTPPCLPIEPLGGLSYLEAKAQASFLLHRPQGNHALNPLTLEQ